MCIIAVAINQHPDFPIIIIDNRDEDPVRIEHVKCLFYSYFFNAKARPTSDAQVTNRSIICAVDKVHEAEGSTWCGLHSTHGNFAVLTNANEILYPQYYYTQESDQLKPKVSRGILVCNVIQDVHYDEYLKSEH